ncbi:hypothetical protein [Rhizobium halophilum]|uniref:hypothetical protein n=1 Tax=Rhizobium halophilum TaxID=2846852 RepID=UPI001EFDEFAE|nr:hypothetical protein [Rhizobium halophilum]MCF6370700.1 hypothetical protein [Rhizobium halophilum]
MIALTGTTEVTADRTAMPAVTMTGAMYAVMMTGAGEIQGGMDVGIVMTAEAAPTGIATPAPLMTATVMGAG